jgi:hypothetical protein
MFCTNCGSKLIDGCKFCSNCGQRITTAPAAPAPIPEPVPAPIPEPVPAPIPEPVPAPIPEPVPAPIPEPVPAPIPEPIAEPIPTPVVENVVYSAPAAPAAAPAPAAEPAHKKKKRVPVALFIILGIVALIAAVVIAGFCTNWFGFYGPASKVILAANKNIKSGSFTIETETTYEYIGEFASEGEHTNKTTAYVMIDVDDRELTYYTYSKDEYGYGYEQAIYNGYSIYHRVTEIGPEFYEYEDISDELDEFFDAYEAANELDLEKLYDILEEQYEVMENLDSDKAIKCAVSYLRKLNNKSWLDENAGYSTDSENGAKIYTFEPKAYNFLNSSLDCFEDAFEDEEDFEELKEGLKEDRKEMNELDYSFSFGVKGGKLVSIDVEYETKYATVSTETEFKNIGSTEIDMDDMKDLLAEAKNYASVSGDASEW